MFIVAVSLFNGRIPRPLAEKNLYEALRGRSLSPVLQHTATERIRAVNHFTGKSN